MNITEEIKRLADKEREVRKLEMMIEHIASLSDEDLAKVLATLASARKHSVANAAPPLRAAITQHELLR
jgi:cytochrome c553